MHCTGCGTQAPENARFCPGCGAALAAAPPPVEERRVVTVVFCDLVGSTALSGRLDPEVLRAVTLRYFELMRSSLTAHGGTVEKFIGDAVMAVFGVPQMHEDDARRALAAALDMAAALADFNLELDAHLGIRLEIRIGVNTGEVITAADRSANQALVAGEVVNLAARLEQHAEAGQILLGPETVRAAGPAAVTRHVGPLTLKGKAEPVPAHQLVELLGDDPELLRRFDLPFIGRTAELAELDLLLERCRHQGRCQLVNVYGDAGIGKTRLVRDWQQGLAGPMLCGSGRCRPYGDAGTLAALAEAVGQLLEEAAVEPASDALELLRCGLLKDGTPNPSLAETVDALAAVLAGLTAEAAVVLVLDDCQWASPVLLDVLDELAEYLDREPLLLLCLARPELLDGRPDWGGGRLNAHSMVLSGLPADESARLAAELVEVSGHDGAVFEQVIERAEGNPLYLEQLCASFAEEAGRGGGQRPLSPTVQALLGSRIDALADPERRILDLASVIGREFDAAGLAVFGGPESGPDGGSPSGDCALGLRRLTRRRLIEPVRGRPGPPVDGAALQILHGRPSSARYRISSGLVQQVAYEAMAKRLRAERHQAYADYLRSAEPADVGEVAALASHLERAYRYRAELGLFDARTERLRLDAADQLGTAGNAALAHVDLCWADDLFGRALALLRPAEPAWAPLAERAGEVLVALGRRTAGLDLLVQALRVATESADVGTAAHARLQLAADNPAAGYGTAAEAAEAALPVFEAAGDQLGLARAGIRIGQALQFRGRHAEAELLLLAAADRAAAIAAVPERAIALGAVGISLWRGPTPAEAAIQRCRQLLAEHGTNRPSVRVTLNCPLAVLLALRERFAEAHECLQVAGQLVRSLGYAEAEVFMPLFGATVAGLAGQPEQAEQLLRTAARACARLGMVGLDAAVSRDLARELLDREAWQEAGEIVGWLPAQVEPGQLAEQLAPSEAADQLGIHARLEAARGNLELADQLASLAVAEAARTDSPVSRGVAALDRAGVLVLAADPAGARAAAGTAAEWFDQKGHLVALRRATALAAALGEVR